MDRSIQRQLDWKLAKAYLERCKIPFLSTDPVDDYRKLADAINKFIKEVEDNGLID